MKIFNKRTPEDIVRRNLDTGNRINLGPNREYLIGLGSTENSDKEIPVIIGTKIVNGEEEEIGLFLERDIFTHWCDDLSEEELWGISESTGLRKALCKNR